MNRQKKIDTRELVVLALMAALAYAAVAVFRIPVVLFLKYEPKDCLLAIAGMLYGPLPALLVATVVSLVEMVTISTTGIIGFVMNVLSSALLELVDHTSLHGYPPPSGGRDVAAGVFAV